MSRAYKEYLVKSKVVRLRPFKVDAVLEIVFFFSKQSRSIRGEGLGWVESIGMKFEISNIDIFNLMHYRVRIFIKISNT